MIHIYNIHHILTMVSLRGLIRDDAHFVVARTINPCPREVLVPGYAHLVLVTNSAPQL